MSLLLANNCPPPITSHHWRRLTNDNQLGRLHVGRVEGLQRTGVVSGHIPGRIQNWYRPVHLLRLRAALVGDIQMGLEPLQGNWVRAGDPLVNRQLVEEPFQDDSGVPGIRFEFTVQNKGFWGAHCIVVQHIWLGHCHVLDGNSRTHCKVDRMQVTVNRL